MDLLGLWRTVPVAWESPLTPEMAASQLQAELTQRHRGSEVIGLPLRGSTEWSFAGQVTGLRFQIYPFRPGTTNSFRSTLRGEILPGQSGGCRVVGNFAYPLWPRVFVAIWMTFVLSLGLIALIGALVLIGRGDQGEVAPPLTIAGGAAGMLAFGTLLISIAGGQGRAGQKRVRDWVATTLAAP